MIIPNANPTAIPTANPHSIPLLILSIPEC
jgi:hypothetical protein